MKKASISRPFLFILKGIATIVFWVSIGICFILLIWNVNYEETGLPVPFGERLRIDAFFLVFINIPSFVVMRMSGKALKKNEIKDREDRDDIDSKPKREYFQTKDKSDGNDPFKEFLKVLPEKDSKIHNNEIHQYLCDIKDIIEDINKVRDKENTNQQSIRQFTLYYRPTLERFLDFYISMQDIKTSTMKIEAMKTDTIEAVHMIRNAFLKLLDNMFEKQVFDVEVEKQTLENMINIDGLSENGFPVFGK